MEVIGDLEKALVAAGSDGEAEQRGQEQYQAGLDRRAAAEAENGG